MDICEQLFYPIYTNFILTCEETFNSMINMSVENLHRRNNARYDTVQLTYDIYICVIFFCLVFEKWVYWGWKRKYGVYHINV